MFIIVFILQLFVVNFALTNLFLIFFHFLIGIFQFFSLLLFFLAILFIFKNHSLVHFCSFFLLLVIFQKTQVHYLKYQTEIAFEYFITLNCLTLQACLIFCLNLYFSLQILVHFLKLSKIFNYQIYFFLKENYCILIVHNLVIVTIIFHFLRPTKHFLILILVIPFHIFLKQLKSKTLIIHQTPSTKHLAFTISTLID